MNEFVRRADRASKHFASRMPALDIELTERCNNDCIHCCINRPANDPDARAREMTTARVKDVLAQAAALGCLQVRLTGGEPLLRADFDDVYIAARRLGLKVLLFTNGCLITPRIADLFARIPPLVPIEITVYGMCQQTYEAVTRRPGSFEQFRRGISLLSERNVPFIVKSVILPQNKHEMQEFEAWAETIPWMTGAPAYAIFLDLRNRRDDVDRNATIESLRISAQDGVALLTRDAERYRTKLAEFASKFMASSGDSLFGCGAGDCMCIDAYGRAQPCMSLRAPELTIEISAEAVDREGEPSVGTSGSTAAAVGLEDALAQFTRLTAIRAKNPEYLRRCARCVLKGLCEQCPAKSWAEHADLDTPVEYLCEVAHAQARYLGWLGSNEQGWEVTDWRERMNSWQHAGIGHTASVTTMESIATVEGETR